VLHIVSPAQSRHGSKIEKLHNDAKNKTQDYKIKPN